MVSKAQLARLREMCQDCEPLSNTIYRILRPYISREV